MTLNNTNNNDTNNNDTNNNNIVVETLQPAADPLLLKYK